MKLWMVMSSLAVVLIGCGGSSFPTETLQVKTVQVRSAEPTEKDDPMARNEQMRRLHGAVSMEERGQRLGQYYTAIWRDPAGVGSGEVEVRFEYQQGKTGSRVKRSSKRFAAADATGTAEFQVVGDDYFKGGRVLAWKITVLRGGRVLDSKQSYLWD